MQQKERNGFHLLYVIAKLRWISNTQCLYSRLVTENRSPMNIVLTLSMHSLIFTYSMVIL